MTSPSAFKIRLIQEQFFRTTGIFGTDRQVEGLQTSKTDRSKTLWLSLSQSGLRSQTEMKPGEVTQSFVCSILSVSETDHTPEQGEILIDPAAVPTVSSLMSRLISLTLTQQQPAAYTSVPGKTLLLQM